MKNGLRLILLLLALAIGLGGVFAAVAVRQVPAGHRLQIGDRIVERGLTIAPLWVDAKVLPPADVPTIHVPEPAPTAEPAAVISARVAAAEAALQTSLDAEGQRDQAAHTLAKKAERAQRDAADAEQVALERRIATLDLEARHVMDQRMAEAEIRVAETLAEGRQQVAAAQARRDAALGRLLAGDAGRYYIAIEAARSFELGDVHLPNPPPDFLLKMGSVTAWRAFFLGAE